MCSASWCSISQQSKESLPEYTSKVSVAALIQTAENSLENLMVTQSSWNIITWDNQRRKDFLLGENSFEKKCLLIIYSYMKVTSKLWIGYILAEVGFCWMGRKKTGMVGSRDQIQDYLDKCLPNKHTRTLPRPLKSESLGYGPRTVKCTNSPPPGDSGASSYLRNTQAGQATGRRCRSSSTAGCDDSSDLQKLSDHRSLSLSLANTRRKCPSEPWAHKHLEERSITKGSLMPSPEGMIHGTTATNYTNWRKRDSPNTGSTCPDWNKRWADSRVRTHSVTKEQDSTTRN